MRQRIGLLVAVVAAVLFPICAATSASAGGEFHVSGVYTTYAECNAAGQAGIQLWGPNFFCTSGSQGWFYLYTH
ncbi:hypothetical protein ACIBSV_07465 [Embleya sp. NPDC050154]|uniref:hypothetical protein n=1 Tax=unclassified Embleya TaxID=2699296 RepID=UPI00379D6752